MQEGETLLQFVILTFNFWLLSLICSSMGDLCEATDPTWPGPASRLAMWPETSVMQSASSFTRCVDFFIGFLYLFRVCFRNCVFVIVSVFSHLCSVQPLSFKTLLLRGVSSLACFFYSKELIRCQLLLLEFDCIWICVCIIISAFDQFVFAFYQMPD